MRDLLNDLRRVRAGQGLLGQVEGDLIHLCQKAPIIWASRRVMDGPGNPAEPVWLEEAPSTWSAYSALNPSWPLFWRKEELRGTGLSVRPEGPAMLRPWSSLPGSNLGPREISAALANRITLSV